MTGSSEFTDLEQINKKQIDKLDTKGDNDMAKLSIRDNPQCSTTVSFNTSDSDGKINLKQLTGEFNMRNIRTVNITLVDSNPHLALEHAIVFSKKDVVTEHNDDKTIQQVMLKEDVNKAIKEHNEKRASTIDKDIQRNTGRGVYLEPVEIWDLEWKIITVA